MWTQGLYHTVRFGRDRVLRWIPRGKFLPAYARRGCQLARRQRIHIAHCPGQTLAQRLLTLGQRLASAVYCLSGGSVASLMPQAVWVRLHYAATPTWTLSGEIQNPFSFLSDLHPDKSGQRRWPIQHWHDVLNQCWSNVGQRRTRLTNNKPTFLTTLVSWAQVL